MPRTSLFAALSAMARRAAARDGLNLPRRAVLAGAATGALAATLRPRTARAANAPTVVIVGAGIAGLCCAMQLIDNGVACTVIEASGRVGGRMESDTTSWENGQVSEHCGELIDTGHTTIRNLARRFGIPMVDLLATEPAGSTATYFFDNAYYPQAQAQADFAPVWRRLRIDLAAAGYPTTFGNKTPGGILLDSISVAQWIALNVPGGLGSPLGQLLNQAYDIEFGAPTTQQSSLNLIYLLGYQNDPRRFTLFGESDERFHMAGGNERLPVAIAAHIETRSPGTIRLNTAMTGLGTDGGGYLLRLADGSEMEADHVVLALPFSVLRTLDIAAAGFDARKRKAIAELGYGSNVKLNVQFNKRLWRFKGPWGNSSNGESFSDTGYQNTWDVTRGQSGRTGILVDFLGSRGAGFHADETAPPAYVQMKAQQFLGQLEPVFPGITGEWNGRATLSTPLRDPFRLGSYSYWKVGQYTTIAGSERLRSGNCHFAGEHCSISYQGYMEGGAQTGFRAAKEILEDLSGS